MAGTKISVACTNEGLFVTRGVSPDVYAFHLGVDGRLKFSQKAAPPPRPAVTRTLIADVIYGAFTLLKGYYVAFITKSARVGTSPGGYAIYQVLDMDWVLVGNGYATSVKEMEKGGSFAGPTLSAAQEHEEETHLALLKRVTQTQSFFYCAGYDLTNTLQRNDAASSGAVTKDAAAASPVPTWVHCDERFWWNRAALREVVGTAANEAASRIQDLVVPVINGFVGSKPAADLGADLLLISRRACARQGTRFNMRGADVEGNVANYAETEQVVLFGNGAMASYVQVRGSIPLLWDQPVTLKYTPKCRLHPGRQQSQGAFNKHAAALLDRYTRVTAVNLIDKKGDQGALGKAFGEAIDSFVSGSGAAQTMGSAGSSGSATTASRAGGAPMRYVWFDFHGETKSGKGGWASLSKLLNDVRGDLEGDGVYVVDAQGKVLATQRGTVRTNCMDNLDRTNVVQSLFARQAVLSSVPGALEKTRASGCSVVTSPFPEFERSFNNMWADNADAMSFLYSGTGALKTDFTRTGKRTLAGALADGMNSVQRYVLNNLDDGRMQDAWDLFLGRYIPGPFGSNALGAGGGKGSGYSPPMKAHLAGMTPGAFLTSLLAMFAGLTLAIAVAVTAKDTPLLRRVGFGSGGASLVLGGLAFAVMGKGMLKGLALGLVSRPSFVVLPPSAGPGEEKGGASFAHLGRERDGVVGGAHAREHAQLVPGAVVSRLSGSSPALGGLEEGQGSRAKVA